MQLLLLYEIMNIRHSPVHIRIFFIIQLIVDIPCFRLKKSNYAAAMSSIGQ
jgi:hypothetical protein